MKENGATNSMATIELHGRIKDGKLEVNLPDGLPPVDVKVTIEVPALANDSSELADSVYGLWADLGMDISEEDIDEARREMWGNFPRGDVALGDIYVS
jgi:hypothetical protein